jgi:two-component system OmpR family response regulator
LRFGSILQMIFGGSSTDALPGEESITKDGTAVANNSDRVTVLLVEDDPGALSFYTDALLLSGFHVVTARTGSEALIRARADSPDVVVADLGLPDFDGFEVCRQIHLDRRLQHVPAIALTGRSMAIRDIEFAERAGFAAVLLKPATPEQLSAAIARARSRANAAPRASDGPPPAMT